MNVIESVERRPKVPRLTLLLCAVVTLSGVVFEIYMWMKRPHAGMADALPFLCVTSFVCCVGQFVLIPKAILILRKEEGESSIDTGIVGFAQIVYLFGLYAFADAAGSYLHGGM